MALIAVAADKGGPGVTTTALALASVWPNPVLLAECDPAGSDLMFRFPAADGSQLDPRRGLLSLAVAGRGDYQHQQVWLHAQKLHGGLDVLVGVTNAEQGGGLSMLWGPLAALLARLPEADVIADCGRLGSDGPVYDLLVEAGAIVLVTRPDFGDIIRLRDRAAALIAAAERRGRRGLVVDVLVVDAPRRLKNAQAEVAHVLAQAGVAVRLVGGLARDPRGAHLMRGTWGGKLDKTLLIRSAREAAGQLAAYLPPPAIPPPAIPAPVIAPGALPYGAWSQAPQPQVPQPQVPQPQGAPSQGAQPVEKQEQAPTRRMQQVMRTVRSRSAQSSAVQPSPAQAPAVAYSAPVSYQQEAYPQDAYRPGAYQLNSYQQGAYSPDAYSPGAYQQDPRQEGAGVPGADGPTRPMSVANPAPSFPPGGQRAGPRHSRRTTGAQPATVPPVAKTVVHPVTQSSPGGQSWEAPLPPSPPPGIQPGLSDGTASMSDLQQSPGEATPWGLSDGTATVSGVQVSPGGAGHGEPFSGTGAPAPIPLAAPDPPGSLSPGEAPPAPWEMPGGSADIPDMRPDGPGGMGPGTE